MKYICIQMVVSMMMILLLSSPVLGADEDAYENDNSYDQARKIIINLETPQLHSFHEATDQDWIKFYGFKDRTYAIKAVNTGTCDLYLELYDANNMSKPIKVQDNPLDPFADEILSTGNVL
ncbi:MAG: hypothetical protein V2I97_01795, partial [Desulfococcaceae bacterium]|nr:hypothetical protein [Desulfococcaceae bacterium]